MVIKITAGGVEPSFCIQRERGAMCCDVYLVKHLGATALLDGSTECMADVRCVGGVVWYPGLEDDVRRRWAHWWTLAGKS